MTNNAEFKSSAEPPQEDYADGRIGYLTRIYMSTVDQAIDSNPATLDYYESGGSIRELLREIEDMEGPAETVTAVTAIRDQYMDTVLTRPTLRNRIARKRNLVRQEEDYVSAVTARIAAVIDARTSQDFLRERQMPLLAQKASFEADGELSMKDFAANHLYLLLDTALQEHAQRRDLIQNHQDGSLRNRLLGNRVLHVAIAGGIFSAAFVPELGIVPTPDEIITTDIELALKVTSGIILGLDVPEIIRLQYLQKMHDKQTQQLQRQLADSQEQTDLALRIIYSSARYGSSQAFQNVNDRFGTTDKAENVRRFELLDETLSQLGSDPGGRPYSGDQALGYAARFLVEHHDHIAAILDCPDKPDLQRERYLALCCSILQEDLARMKKGLTVTRYRKDIMKAIGIVPAVLFPSVFGPMSDATTMSRDTTEALAPSPPHHPEA